MSNSASADWQAEVAGKSNDEVEAQYYDWNKWALDKQRPPAGDWTTWLLRHSQRYLNSNRERLVWGQKVITNPPMILFEEKPSWTN